MGSGVSPARRASNGGGPRCWRWKQPPVVRVPFLLDLAEVFRGLD
jgi:hypothetical protein